jgi:hypothetical protein
MSAATRGVLRYWTRLLERPLGRRTCAAIDLADLHAFAYKIVCVKPISTCAWRSKRVTHGALPT